MKAEIVIISVKAGFVFQFTELEDETFPKDFDWDQFCYFVKDSGIIPTITVDIIREAKRSTPEAEI